MSAEKMNPNIEHSPENEKSPKDTTEHIRSPEKELTKAEKEHGQAEQLENLKASAIEKATDTSEFRTAQESKLHSDDRQHPVMVNKHLKDMSYHRALTRARKKLSAPSKLFSKAIHSPAVEKTSESVGNTVARPSSMLGGALLAFLGTSLLLWASRRYGYDYNYLVFVMVFVIGMLLGLSIEGAYKLYKSRSN